VNASKPSIRELLRAHGYHSIRELIVKADTGILEEAFPSLTNALKLLRGLEGKMQE
jgi:hypothetical protein